AFAYRLDPGRYTLSFQFIGYETQVKRVDISNAYIELNIVLKEQVYDLQQVEVMSDGKDPAYTIMRKTIAKAPFHLNQLNTYRAEVYMKGSGRLKKSPFFLRKAIRKEGIDSSFAFVSESVSEISYRRPNYFEEKVISIYTTGDSRSSSPNAYVNASFYEPTVGDVVSPLSPRAFAYYKFSYEGFFVDQGREINKIRVTPRSKGDKVVDGVINIVDGEWSIHSLDLRTFVTSPAKIIFDIKQIYAPIEGIVWLPVSHQFDGTIKILGFEIDFYYLATVSDYRIELNPDLNFEMEVIDETVEQQLAKELTKEIKKSKAVELQDIEQRLATDKKVTRKELKKMIKAYEKQERKERKEPRVESITKYEIDSMAYKRDSVYWVTIRPVPLNQYEVRGYRKIDSLETVEEENSRKDSLGIRKNGFRWTDFLLGNSYSLGNNNRFYLKSTLTSLQFNTVEGYSFQYGMGFRKDFKREEKGANQRWFLESDIRYGFSREKFNYRLTSGYDFGRRGKRGKLRLQGGKYLFQYNADRPIHPFINSVWSLLFERNYMKLYEKDFVDLTYQQQLAPNFSADAGIEWSDRNTVMNNTTHVYFDQDDRLYTSNIPESLETDAAFPEHQALVARFGFSTRPWLRYRIRNDRKYVIEDSSPTLFFKYRQGIQDALGSDVGFSHFETGFRHELKIGIRGKLDIKAQAGFFLNEDEAFFPDYQHFAGNQTILVTADPIGSYRLLDYYRYSTNDVYVNAHAHYQFRKFLATQFLWVQFLGIKENVFVNYLHADTNPQYFELGYSIDNILRFLRLELVTAFVDGKYDTFGIRIGIASNLGEF
ncbi:MAG: DUF5686 family protein, partial [Bacteroidota bacterium]